MFPVIRSMPSPRLHREIPVEVLPVWPALAPQYGRVPQMRLLSLQNVGGAAVSRQAEGLVANEAWSAIREARQSLSLIHI